MRTELAPLLAVSGAPGAGKSTVFRELVAVAEGMVVIDIDELLEEGRLLGVLIAAPEAEPIWPAYRRMWRRITDMPRRAGHPVLFFSPDTPSDVDGATAHLLLDCADEVRAGRLQARGWNLDQITLALEDAQVYRAQFEAVVYTDDAEPPEVAERVLEWAKIFAPQ
ncbi:AAA family ATPase [Glycomyces harbinensis]|uniref:Broad-specificity NMP kinase n=1 Tax=Glycomyces harbinensis TaxID=58114 RepID=A0A1G7A1D3_9ACTN|nr:AAA family ATPase [Glycomyces harbinensis]SDE08619.1 Broad-specificity NMP kinase [Glycomyces harbinensis]